MIGIGKSWRRQSGRAALIGLVVVILIMLVATLQGPLKTNKKGVTQAQQTVNQARDAGCAANRMSLRTDFINWRLMNNATSEVNPAILEKVIRIPVCPSGGIYLFGPDDNVYCTVHNPPPPQMLAQMITLSVQKAQQNAQAPTAVQVVPSQVQLPNLNLIEPTQTPTGE